MAELLRIATRYYATVLSPQCSLRNAAPRQDVRHASPYHSD